MGGHHKLSSLRKEADWPTIVFYIFNSSWPRTLYIAKNGLEFAILPLTHPELGTTGVAHHTWFYRMLRLNLDFAHARQALSQLSAWLPPPPPCNSLIVAVIYGVLPISK